MRAEETMGAPDALSFAGLGKTYRLYATPRDRFLEALTGRRRHAEVRALEDVTGSVPAGSVVGLVGENGSGKSTLLKILAGTTEPTTGSVTRRGRIASILELGSSFHPEVTGRRNAVLQAALTGLSRAEVDASLPAIEAFAELGEFFDRPVKTYSSGMQMRLAFAVATAVLPDVVILDEALAVGDGYFQKKCVDRIFELKSSGRTILFCSHAMYYVSTLCDTAIWLCRGKVMASGKAEDVVLKYEDFLARQEEAARAAESKAEPRHEGPGRFTAIRLLGAGGEPATAFRTGDPFVVEAEFEADDPAHAFQLHAAVATRDQVTCFSADTRRDGAGPFSGARRHAVRLQLPSLSLNKGEFVLHIFLGDEKALALYDTRSAAFHIESDEWQSGLFRVPCSWSRVAPPGGTSGGP